MHTSKTLSLYAALLLCLGGVASAAGLKTYEVTGPILEMNDNSLTIQKGKERWEIARSATTKATGELKVGAKVTVTYTMGATAIVAKETPKAAASPGTTKSGQ